MSRRSYGQYCGLARALDVVGKRWSLLIVRELLLGPARYTELAAALSGVATNLLADRLRGLVSVGVVERRLDPDSNGVVYALTPWGAQLREPIDALVRWSTPLMSTGRGEDTFRGPWLAVALRALLRDRTSTTPVAVGLHTANTVMTVQLEGTGPVSCSTRIRHRAPFCGLTPRWCLHWPWEHSAWSRPSPEAASRAIAGSWPPCSAPATAETPDGHLPA